MMPLRRFIYPLIAVLATVFFGTVGYRALEGWSWFDGLYMTVITLATIGYGETHPLTPAGRAFT
ncbi:MAG TPA: potassium channel family protein, partial [Blastocatellia bacterium]|nr:potassium channel family protein [Blastocatellia bacterium]